VLIFTICDTPTKKEENINKIGSYLHEIILENIHMIIKKVEI